MAPKLRVEHIEYPLDDREGAVWFEVVHADGSVEYFRQPFNLGPSHLNAAGCPIWGWDGKLPLTLTGMGGLDSFDSTSSRGTRVHGWMRDGAFVLDSNATVEW